MAKNGVAKNYLYNVSYQILLMILPLITTPYVSRVLGAANVGIYGFTQSVSQYFILFGSIGVALYGQREIAFLQSDISKRTVVFWELVIMRAVTVSVTLLVYYLTIVAHGSYPIIYQIMLIDIVASVFDISWFLQGLEEFKKVTLRNFIIKFISVILIFTLVKTQENLPLYTLIISGSLLVGNLSLWLYLPKMIVKIKLHDLKPYQHLRPVLILFLPQIATSIYTMLDRTMIGLLSNTTEVGYYDQAQKIVKMALTIVSSLGTVMMPRIANTYANKDRQKIQYYLSQSFQFVYFLALPITFGLMVTASGIIPWFLGAGFEPSISIMMLTSPIVLMIGLSNLIGMQYLMPTLRQNEFTLSVILGCMINFTLNLLLIPFYQSMGAAFATVIAETSVTAIQFWFVRKNFSFIQSIKLMKNYFLASLIMAVIVLGITKILPISLISSLIEVVVGIIVYLSILFVLRDQFLGKIIYKLLKK